MLKFPLRKILHRTSVSVSWCGVPCLRGKGNNECDCLWTASNTPNYNVHSLSRMYEDVSILIPYPSALSGLDTKFSKLSLAYFWYWVGRPWLRSGSICCPCCVPSRWGTQQAYCITVPTAVPGISLVKISCGCFQVLFLTKWLAVTKLSNSQSRRYFLALCRFGEVLIDSGGNDRTRQQL